MDFVPAKSEGFCRSSGLTAKSVNVGVRGIKRQRIRSSHFSLRRRAETALGLDKAYNAVEAFALPEIGHDKRPFATHPPGVGVHFLQRCADMRREVNLVDDEKVRAGDGGATFRGNLGARSDVDHVDGEIG